MTTNFDPTDIQVAAATYSDLYKEIHGIRPRWMRWEGATAADIWEAVDDLSTASRESDDWKAVQADYQAMDDLEALLAADRAQAEAEVAEDALWASLEARACGRNVNRACQQM